MFDRHYFHTHPRDFPKRYRPDRTTPCTLKQRHLDRLDTKSFVLKRAALEKFADVDSPSAVAASHYVCYICQLKPRKHIKLLAHILTLDSEDAAKVAFSDKELWRRAYELYSLAKCSK